MQYDCEIYDLYDSDKTYDPKSSTEADEVNMCNSDTSMSPHDGDNDLVWDDMLCPQSELKRRSRSGILNSTSRGIVPDFGSGLTNNKSDKEEKTSSSSSLHCYDVISESLEIISKMNDVVTIHENENISVLERSLNSNVNPGLELYRKSRETISDTLEILKSQLALKKKLAREFESRVEGLNEEFLGFTRVNSQNLVDPVVVDVSDNLADIDVPDYLDITGEGTNFDKYFDGNNEVSQSSSRLSSTSVVSGETRVRVSVLTDGSILETIERLVVVSPSLPHDRPVTRSRGNVMELPNVMKGPIEFQKYKLD